MPGRRRANRSRGRTRPDTIDGHADKRTFPSGGQSFTTRSFEAETAPGLEGFVRDEIRERLGPNAEASDTTKPGNVPFTWRGEPLELLDLRTAYAVYAVHRFDIPRPLALLGHQHFTRLTTAIREILALAPSAHFHTFRVNAAGSRSPAYLRLRQAIADDTGLLDSTDEADLLIRVRRPLSPPNEGFEVSIRLTERPLSARSWRVCDMPGALNAAVARAMVRLTAPHADDVFVNIACGSGTLMIERLAEFSADRVIGVDTSASALDCARANIEAAGFRNRTQLHGWDACDMPLPDGCVTSICADLPFGHLIGSHEENERLYPELLTEVGRVAASNARFVLISSEARLLEKSLALMPEIWQIERIIRISVDNARLRIYLLRRRPR